MPIQRLASIGLFTALFAVLAQIAIPLPISPVPVTGQLIGIFLAGTILGGKGAFLAVLAYLMLGAAGLPVFSMARGGLVMLAGPTGGYLWGFLPAAFISGKLQETPYKPSFLRTTGAGLLGLSFIYLWGALQLGLITGYTPMQVFLTGVAPFMPLDIAKVIMAAALGAKIKRKLRQSGLNTPGS